MTTDEIDEKLARLGRRVQARRDAVRCHLETRPQLAALLGGWKSTFGPIRLSHIAIGDWSDGDPEAIYRLDGQPAHRFTPAEYVRPLVGRKGKMQMMRERENAQP